MTTPAADDLVVLGRISGVFGVKGWLKVWSYTDPVEGILDHPVWQIRMPQGWDSCEWESGQRQGKGIIVRLPGCDDRELARRFVQADVAVPRSALPLLSAAEYYWYQLEGLQVYAVRPQAEPVWLGTVDHLLETGANEVLVVEPAEGSLDDQTPFAKVPAEAVHWPPVRRRRWATNRCRSQTPHPMGGRCAWPASNRSARRW